MHAFCIHADTQTDTETDRQTDRQTGTQAGRQADTQTDRQTERQRQTDRETETDRQTETETDKPWMKRSAVKISTVKKRAQGKANVPFSRSSSNSSCPHISMTKNSRRVS